MKKLHIIAVAILATLSANAQSVFYEDFENGLTEQFTQDFIVGTVNWVTDPNAVNIGPGPGVFEGDSSAFFYFPGYTGDITTLTSPSIDLSTGGYRLSFAYIQPNWVGDQNTLSVYYSGDDGATWTLIDSLVGDIQDYVEVEYVLDNYATTTATSKIRFSGWIDYGYAIGVDVVNVFLPESDDAELTMAISPLDGCGLGNELVGIEVFNNGLDTIFSIDATYEVGVNMEMETFTVEIPSGQVDTLWFNVPVDMSTPGTYDFTAWVDLNEDANQANDTIWFSSESIPVISSLPYTEDFENGAGGWTSGGTLDPWELGDPETVFIDTANSGINAWVTNLDGTYENGTDAFVESPCFDLSGLSLDPVFRFAFMTNSELGFDGTWVEVSTDAGATWATVGAFGEGTNWYTNEDEHGANFDEDWWDEAFGAENEWTVATHLLDGAAGSSSVKIRVFFHSDGSVNTAYDGFAFDDVELFEQPSINAGVTEILAPVSGCGLGSETVTVVIENFGDADLVDFSVEYNAGAGVITETVTDTIFAATTDTFTFATPVDLSVVGNHNFGAWTAVVGDGDLLNDSLFISVFSSPVVSSFPYSEDFESGEGGWYSTGDEGMWEFGDPEGLLIDTAGSGVNAWATNLNTVNYNNNQLSYLYSPCFDFSGLAIDPILEFGFIGNSEIGWDGMWLEVSTDAGTTWSTLGNFGEGTNWYNNEDEHGINFDEDWWDGNTADTTGWIMAEHLIDGVAGASNVMIRFVFDSDGSISTYEGFAVDDISVTEQPAVNGSLFSINGPISNCGMTATETISVTVTNLGSLDMDSVIVEFSLDNGPVMSEVFNDTLDPNESIVLNLTNTIDLSAEGDYNLEVWVNTIGDGDTSNDSLQVVITSVPTISTLPYEQDFETGNGGWRSVSINQDWELGDPEGLLIDTAFSGVNAWATNLNNPNYENSELSVLQSPCFDFSAMSDDPVMSFALQHDSEIGWDGTWLEMSIDGGTTWSTVGNMGEGENWYTNNVFGNPFILQGWDGQSGNAGEWVIAEHILDGAAGISNVQLRFVFSSDASFNGFEGFAVDDISIHPQPQLDLVVLSFDGPSENCSLDQEEVSMTFWNKGLMTVSNFDVGFVVDAGAAQTEVYTGSVANGDTVSYTFVTEMADLSVAGSHQIDVFTALAGDENTDSDTLYGNEVINHGDLTPMSQTDMPGSPISATILEGTSSQIYFCGLPTALDGCLEIANVTIDSIAHTWLSDLTLSLISPAGDTLELSSGNGGSADDMSNVVFTDTSTNDITLQVLDILPGIYHTEDAAGFASMYNGQDPNGPWTLWVQDLVGGDDGTLVSWSMTFEDHSPNPMLAYADTTICLTQVLEVSSDEYDSYLWSTGHNTQTAQLFGNVLGLGTYEISVTVDEDGCTGVSNSFTLTVDACAGVEELGGLSVDVYPNPSNGRIFIDVTGESDNMNIEVLDMHGKLVFTESTGNIISGVRKAVDLTSLANGMYFLRMESGNAAITKKIVKQ